MDSRVIMSNPESCARTPPALAALNCYSSAQGLFPAEYSYGFFIPEKEQKDKRNHWFSLLTEAQHHEKLYYTVGSYMDLGWRTKSTQEDC